MNGAAPLLPAEFSDLEGFADWALPSETARNHKRIESTQEQLETFVAALMPRLEAICRCVDGYPAAALPEPVQRLFCMLLSVAELAPSIEGFHQPRVPNGYDSRRFRAQEDFVLRPRF